MTRLQKVTAAGVILGLFFAPGGAEAQQTEQRQPIGWVRIAYDYDNDQEVDAYEYIHSDDLLEAKQKSAQRRVGTGNGNGDSNGDSNGNGETGLTDLQQQSQQQQRQVRVQGQVEDLRIFTLGNRQRLAAKVRTQNNRIVPVILGDPSQLNRLNLMRNDTIEVVGRQVRVNERPSLEAHQIRANNQRVTIHRRAARRTAPSSRQQPQSWTSGTIEELREVKIYGQATPHLVAAVETEADNIRIVDLGPVNQLAHLDLDDGDEIQVRGTRGTINNNEVIVADRVQANGDTAQIRRTWSRGDFRLSGEIIRTSTQTMPGDGRVHLVAVVETDRGNRYTVDLGPQQRLEQEDLDITSGEEITLIVRPSPAGRQVLEATKISFDDEVFMRDFY